MSINSNIPLRCPFLKQKKSSILQYILFLIQKYLYSSVYQICIEFLFFRKEYKQLLKNHITLHHCSKHYIAVQSYSNGKVLQTCSLISGCTSEAISACCRRGTAFFAINTRQPLWKNIFIYSGDTPSLCWLLQPLYSLLCTSLRAVLPAFRGSTRLPISLYTHRSVL